MDTYTHARTHIHTHDLTPVSWCRLHAERNVLPFKCHSSTPVFCPVSMEITRA